MSARRLALAGVGRPAAADGKWGLVDQDRWKSLNAEGTHLHVRVNGKDVTTRCKWADDVEGAALIYLHHPRGRSTMPLKEAEDVLRIEGGVEIFVAHHAGQSCDEYIDGGVRSDDVEVARPQPQQAHAAATATSKSWFDNWLNKNYGGSG